MAVVAAYSKRNVFGLQPAPQAWNSLIVINAAGELEVGGTGARIYGRSPLGDMTAWSYRLRFRKGANLASGSGAFVAPLTSGNATSFRNRFGFTNTTFIFDDNTGTAVSGGTITGLVEDTVYEIVAYGTTTTVVAQLWNVDTSTQVGSTINVTDTFSAVDNWRMGQATSSPNIPTYEIIAYALYNTGGSYPPAFDLGTDETGPTIAIIGDSLFDMDSDQTNTTPPDGPGLFEDALVARGYKVSNTFYYAAGGKRISVADSPGKTTVQNLSDAKNQLAGGSALDYVILSLGTNDRAQTDSTINGHLDTVLAAIDTATEILWVNLTSKGSASTRDGEVNALIAAKLAAWGGTATLLDWNSHIRGLDGGSNPSDYWYTGDSTHNTLLGNQAKVDFVIGSLPDLSLTTVTKTLDVRWDVRETVAKNLAPRWDVHETVAKTKPLAWDVREAIAKTVALRWDVLATVAVSSVVAWDVHQTVGGTQVLAWDVHGTVDATVAVAWGVRTLVAKATGVSWDVHQTVTQTHVLAWDVRAVVERTLDIRWDVESEAGTVVVTKTLNIRWDTRETVPVIRLVRWDVRTTVARTAGIAWSIRETVPTTLPVAWDILAIVTKAQPVAWDVLATIPVSRAVSWAVHALVTRAFAVAWDVEATTPTFPGVLTLDVAGDALTLVGSTPALTLTSSSAALTLEASS